MKNYWNCVREQCHITERYRGAAHNACNLQLRLSTAIPAVFHNLHGYDSHLLMQAISKMQGNVNCIPNNTEKYISFSLEQLRFIDSVQYLLASLDRLVKAQDLTTMHITREYEPDDEKCNLLLRKGVYPYEHMDDWARFHEPKLPPRDAFYSALNYEGITDGDYDNAQKVWSIFGCKTMGDCPDLYLRTDVLLLIVDVIENFIKTCMHGDLPNRSSSLIHKSRAFVGCVLKHSGVELELLTDYDLHLYILLETYARWYIDGLSTIRQS